MPDILSLLQCLLPQINATTMRQLNHIIIAMLAMSGRVTMPLNLPPLQALAVVIGRLLILRLSALGFRYVREMLKMLPETPKPILLTQIFAKFTSLGRIHPVSTGVEPS
ncbi:MAG: hypothetical protein V7K92_20060 [Nostoc sp.]